MKKRLLPLFLSLMLLLAGCSPSAETEQSSYTILEVMYLGATEAHGEIYAPDGEDLDVYLQERYGIAPEERQDASLIHSGGAMAFELAVIRLADDTDAKAAQKSMQNYLTDRQGDFTGYAPDQAKLAKNGLVLRRGQWLALIISEHPDARKDAFESCFGNGVNAVGTPQAYIPETDASGRVLYVDPEIDDMTLYDTSAILTAWKSGDTSSLSEKDAAILKAAETVLRETVAEYMSDYEKEFAVYTWLTSTVVYDWNHQNDPKAMDPDSGNPYGGLVNHKAICLGFATTFQLLMDMADVECITVVGAAFQSREDHAWNMVRLNDKWYCLDATWDMSYVDWGELFRYFNVTSDHMAETDHQWDYDTIPEATATDGGNGQ